MQNREQHIGIRIFFLALFMSYFVGITFFTHKHIIEGEVIVHSHFVKHPFSSAPNQLPDHSHSIQVVDLIANLSSWTSDMLEQSKVPTDTWIDLPLQLFGYTLFISQNHWNHCYLRGPPELFHIL